MRRAARPAARPHGRRNSKELDWFNSGEIVALGLVALVSFVLFLVWELTEAHYGGGCLCSPGAIFVTGTLTLSVAYSLFLAAS